MDPRGGGVFPHGPPRGGGVFPRGPSHVGARPLLMAPTWARRWRLQLRAAAADFGRGLRLVLLEVLAEQRGDLLGLLVVGGLVCPGVARQEHLARDLGA